ncbi:alpha/beta hydrolase [Aurantiacibacter luteus]|uniref:Dienelactone hydrolase domain-containing protein n=1 Tax=Aurantiacibacter luteus TaxID=1581420 RepID=A0A0G9MKS7_9SPHN|nr:alpha/beta hydrolase [Aurantiacibacter luteus]KLE31287.1 hypothetical protein AAW00_14105 [Aurantiacibacter luteus]
MMKAILSVVAGLVFGLAAPAEAQPRFDPADPPEELGIALYPDQAPTPEEQWFRRNGGMLMVRNVTRPTVTPFLPDPRMATGAAVVVVPGGAFLGLAMENEAYPTARWLADHGIAAFVLKYRVVPTPRDMTAIPAAGAARIGPPADTPDYALADGLAAMELVRSRASEFGIAPDRVGMLGFSAGAFLTQSVIRTADARHMPDFAASIYGPMRAMDVPANAPPLFVMVTADDDTLPVTSLDLVESYRAAGKPLEFHLLASGGHGFGIGRPNTSSFGWIHQFHLWLDSGGFLSVRQ